MAHRDPYSPDRNYYECRDCGSRATADHTPVSCPHCGGRVRNIGVARE